MPLRRPRHLDKHLWKLLRFLEWRFSFQGVNYSGLGGGPGAARMGFWILVGPLEPSLDAPGLRITDLHIVPFFPIQNPCRTSAGPRRNRYEIAVNARDSSKMSSYSCRCIAHATWTSICGNYSGFWRGIFHSRVLITQVFGEALGRPG